MNDFDLIFTDQEMISIYDRNDSLNRYFNGCATRVFKRQINFMFKVIDYNFYNRVITLRQTVN